jgi:hypothetical protein
MSGTRPSVFDEDIDLSRFAPKSGAENDTVSPETMRRISEESGFPSRAPSRPTVGQLTTGDRRRSLTKTGRTVLLNARITQRAHDRYHEIVEAERLRYESGEIMHRVTLGEVVERALAALEREMARDGSCARGSPET